MGAYHGGSRMGGGGGGGGGGVHVKTNSSLMKGCILLLLFACLFVCLLYCFVFIVIISTRFRTSGLLGQNVYRENNSSFKNVAIIFPSKITLPLSS